MLNTYPEHELARRFIEGVKVGHEDMPTFDFNVLAADALVAYLRSLSAQADSEKRF